MRRFATVAVLPLLAVVAAACDGPTRPTGPRQLSGTQSGPAADAVTMRLARFTAQDLGVLPGETIGEALWVSDRGDVVGFLAPDAGFPRKAFLYTTTMQDLGVLPGDIDAGANFVSDRRHVVGFSGGQSYSNAFLWTPRQGMRQLPALNGATFMSANAINDFDDIAGCAFVPAGALGAGTHLVRWRAPRHELEDLGRGPDGGGACVDGGMNPLGMEIAVDIHADGSNPHAARFDSRFKDLGLPPGMTAARSSGINLEGDVTGDVSGPGDNPFTTPDGAFLWTPRTGLRVLPSLPGDHAAGGGGVNGELTVVGPSLASHTATCFHPWILRRGEEEPALLPAFDGFHPEADCVDGAAAFAINDFDVIVGAGLTTSGLPHPARWVAHPRDQGGNERDGDRRANRMLRAKLPTNADVSAHLRVPGYLLFYRARPSSGHPVSR